MSKLINTDFETLNMILKSYYVNGVQAEVEHFWELRLRFEE